MDLHLFVFNMILLHNTLNLPFCLLIIVPYSDNEQASDTLHL